MKNKDNKVIYVGKSKELKKRVSSYFNTSAKTPKTEILVSHIKDFEFIITQTEIEALVLENNLIKKYSPKYNIRMRDDKSYPYIVCDKEHEFPQIEYKRRVKREKNLEVFGPYATGSNVSEVLRIVVKSFNLRDCSDRELKSRKKPCLLYQMHQCSAPCVDKISDVEYEKMLNLALSIFRNKPKKSLAFLEKRMLEHSEKEEFEQAAIIRDHLEVLNEFLSYSNQRNAEVTGLEKNLDLVAYHRGEVEVDVCFYLIRNGALLGNKNFHFPLVDCDDEVDEEVIKFVLQYYSQTHDSLPDALVSEIKGIEDLAQAFERMDLNKKIKTKKSSTKYKSLMELVKTKAQETQRVRVENQESVFVGLNKLKELLKLKDRPRLLECYDVAIFQGSSPTASQIVYEDGKADKKKYRYYHLEERAEGNNDFAMMKEVLSRRIQKGDFPDVFIVDGGVGQVNIFKGVLEEFKIDIPVVGIAKSKAKKIEKTEERLFIPGRSNPYILKKNMSLFRIITSMRDEAHRFSRKLHHKAEKKRTFKSWLDDIPGIGPKRKKEILQKLDLPLNELKNFSQEQLIERFELPESVAQKIINYFDSLS